MPHSASSKRSASRRASTPAAAGKGKKARRSSSAEPQKEIFIPATLVKQIGAGAMGNCTMYRTNGGDEYVLKTFKDDFNNADVRMGLEIEALRRLDHPNIVPVIHFTTEPPSFIMPYYGNGNLRSFLEGRTKRVKEEADDDNEEEEDDHGSEDAEEEDDEAGTPKRCAVAPVVAVTWMAQLLEALEAAHNAQVLHRDLKAENILIDDDEAVLIADWGCAYLFEDGSHSTMNMGTVRAPELFKGAHPSPRTDVYCLGDVFETILEFSDNPFFSEFMTESIINKMMHRTPELRFQNCGEVRAALKVAINAFTAAVEQRQRQHAQEHQRRVWG